MESAISQQWYQLYENNPKIQAFAVAKEGEVVWQTENWNLLEDIKSIIKAPEKAAGKVSANGVKYKRANSLKDKTTGTAGSNQVHLLKVKITDSSWAIAWAK